MAKHEKCIGITITDLLWHPKHRNNKELLSKIEESFKENIENLPLKVTELFYPAVIRNT